MAAKKKASAKKTTKAKKTTSKPRYQPERSDEPPVMVIPADMSQDQRDWIGNKLRYTDNAERKLFYGAGKQKK